ncbi:MAG: outer membrane lipoprotein carrier protein LolA [Kofleriaceae bacterium]
MSGTRRAWRAARVGAGFALAVAMSSAAEPAAAPGRPASAAAAAPGRTAPAPAAASANVDGPPADLLRGKPVRGEGVKRVFARLALEKMACTFREEKHVALLARPLRSSGTLVFQRGRGVVRVTAKPRAEKLVVTATSLRRTKGARVEEVPLSKSRDLKAFALILPTLLRGDREELERSFELALFGDPQGWWALTFTPKAESLRGMVRRVAVIGHEGVLSRLEVAEVSGDTTETSLQDIRKDQEVSDADVAAAFGAP